MPDLDTGGFHDDTTEPIVQHAGKEFRGLEIGKLLLPGLHQIENGIFVKRKKLQVQNLAVSTEGDGS